MKRQPSFLKTLIFAALFFFAGLMVFKHITQPLAQEAAASKEWPTVEGVVSYSELTKTRDTDGNSMYSPNIQYYYTVNGDAFQGSDIQTVDGSTSLKSSVKKTLAKYPKGKTVTVFYDPDYPSIAVLEPGASFLFTLLLKVPLLFCFFAVIMVFSLFKRLLFGR